ncbi:MAG: glycosyltransferase, partial [Candidatus Pacearchaeota archaeon]|nr:glycosyltransferase [Candidatus Pacearchaeota archaeon]
MRILHVTKKYPNALGGDAIVVQNLEKQQIKNGHKVFVLTTNCDEIINKENLTKFGLKDTPSDLDKITFRRILSLIQLYFKSFKILREIKPDVVHSHSVDMGYIMSFACRRYSIPIINHFHAGFFLDKKDNFVRFILMRVILSLSNFDKIITINENDFNKNKGKF